MKEKNWIIGVCCSDGNGVHLEFKKGTELQIKKYLVRLVKEDRKNNPDEFDIDQSTTSVEEIRVEDNALLGYALFSDYHIDYTAMQESDLIRAALSV